MRTLISQCLVLSVVMSLLGGCAASSVKPTQTEPERQADPLATKVGESNGGDLVKLGTIDGLVSQEYFAASGRVCKRFLPLDAGESIRIACQSRSGNWYLQRILLQSEESFSQSGSSLSSQSIIQVGNAMPESTSTTGQTTNDSVQSFELRYGEGLSSFAKRVTGNAKNWVLIAKTNQLVDPDKVRAGQMLKVPADLVRVR